jgi:hypothetical protein
MKKVLLLALLAIGCTDKKDRCYECEVIYSNTTYKQPVCGYSFARYAEAYIQTQHSPKNTVVNGGYYVETKCKRVD